MDITKQLETYIAEYHVLQEEMLSLRAAQSTGIKDKSDKLVRLQVTNDGLRRQKMELLEQLQVIDLRTDTGNRS